MSTPRQPSLNTPTGGARSPNAPFPLGTSTQPPAPATRDTNVAQAAKPAPLATQTPPAPPPPTSAAAPSNYSLPATHYSLLPPGAYTNLPELIALRNYIEGFSFLPHQPVHSVLSGRHASVLRGRGLNFEEVRRYFPGDDIRTMDWHVTARTGKPHVRVYTEERDRPVLLLIDQRRSMFFGSRLNMKSVTAAHIAALSAWRVLKSGDRIGAIVFNDTDQIEIPPQRSERQVHRILESIIQLNHALKPSPCPPPSTDYLNNILTRAARLATHDYLVTLITDAAGADQSTIEPVTRLHLHNDVIIILVHDPLEMEIPPAGRLVATDGHQQLELNTADRRFRETYAADFQTRLAKIHDLSIRRATPLLLINTAEDAATQLRRLIGNAREKKQEVSK